MTSLAQNPMMPSGGGFGGGGFGGGMNQSGSGFGSMMGQGGFGGGQQGFGFGGGMNQGGFGGGMNQGGFGGYGGFGGGMGSMPGMGYGGMGFGGGMGYGGMGYGGGFGGFGGMPGMGYGGFGGGMPGMGYGNPMFGGIGGLGQPMPWSGFNQPQVQRPEFGGFNPGIFNGQPGVDPRQSPARPQVQKDAPWNDNTLIDIRNTLFTPPPGSFDSRMSDAQRTQALNDRLGYDTSQFRGRPGAPQQAAAQQQPANLTELYNAMQKRQSAVQQLMHPQPPTNTQEQKPQDFGSFGFDKGLTDYLNQQRQGSALDAGVAYTYDPATKTFSGNTMGGKVTKTLDQMQQEAQGQGQMQAWRRSMFGGGGGMAQPRGPLGYGPSMYGGIGGLGQPMPWSNYGYNPGYM